MRSQRRGGGIWLIAGTHDPFFAKRPGFKVEKQGYVETGNAEVAQHLRFMSRSE
jgi:hypothetical protein